MSDCDSVGKEITGVILSAGKGSRIDPFNAHFPKPLLPIGNKPIMEHHLDLFKSIGIKQVHIVVGHLMDRIINQFGRGSELGMDIQYVEQEHILGIAHAVGRIESRVDGPFLLCLGDIFFLTQNFHRLVERYQRGDVAAVLAVKEESSVEPVKRNFTVETDEDGYVKRVVEKPRSPRTLIKGCGIYLFGPEIFDAIRRTPRTALRDEYEITNSIQLLIEDGYKVATEPVIDWDLNVTFPSDLVDGNLAWLDRLGVENLVDPTAQISGAVDLHQCIIGRGVHIQGPRRLSQSVVLPHTILQPGEDLHRCLVSKDLIARC
ncbi:MAG TPA: nucleotidyltransferase family protein [Planctomycetota bacterium]|nr:nucleotidyltransferase family protein [Planctomycetota bacterium]